MTDLRDASTGKVIRLADAPPGAARRATAPARAARHAALFRDAAQRDAALAALLRAGGVAHVWGPAGPSRAAFVAAEAGAPDDGRVALLRFAWDLYRTTGARADRGYYDAPARRLLDLPPAALGALGSLLAALAVGPDAVDCWLALQEAP